MAHVRVRRLLQDHDGVLARANSRCVRRLQHRPVPADRRQGETHRRLLLPQEGPLTARAPAHSRVTVTRSFFGSLLFGFLIALRSQWLFRSINRSRDCKHFYCDTELRFKVKPSTKYSVLYKYNYSRGIELAS